VLGPKSRLNDPGRNFDQDLFNQQSNATRAIYTTIRDAYAAENYTAALGLLFTLRNINNVNWIADQPDQPYPRYRVGAGLPNVPGTAGYAYDTYVQ
jgi:hypothetical protein